MKVEEEKERDALEEVEEEEEVRMSGEEVRVNEEMVVLVQLRCPDVEHAMREYESETEWPVMLRELSFNTPLDVTSNTERVKES